jgi:hypothetical protein
MLILEIAAGVFLGLLVFRDPMLIVAGLVGLGAVYAAPFVIAVSWLTAAKIGASIPEGVWITLIFGGIFAFLGTMWYIERPDFLRKKV